MKISHLRLGRRAGTCTAIALVAAACSANLTTRNRESGAEILRVGPETVLGKPGASPSTPFLRYAPNGGLFAVWTEDHENPWPQGKQPASHQHGMRGDRATSPMRNAFIAASSDGGRTWSSPKRVNSDIEAVQGEENGPKIAFDGRNRAHVVWSIPGGKGD